jgi:hypothetical protein
MSVTNTPERQRRIAQAWERDPTATLDDVVARVDADLEAEHAEETERAARADTLADSVAAFWSCRACRAAIAPGVRDGYCDRCRTAAHVLAGLAALDDRLDDGRTRRDAIETELAARQKANGS